MNISSEAFIGLSVGGQFVNYFVTEPYYAAFGGFFPEPTAPNVQTALEAAYGAGNVEVTGIGPEGRPPLTIKSIGEDSDKAVPGVEAFAVVGSVESTVAVPGRPDAKIVATVENLGDGAADGAGAPIVITDMLPKGVRAVSVEGFAGTRNEGGPGTPGTLGPVACNKTLPSEPVSCAFEGVVPPYRQIEVVIGVIVEPGASSGEVNEVSVSGGGAGGRMAKRKIVVGGETGFGVEDYELGLEKEDGSVETRAGSHPFQLTSVVTLNQLGEAEPASPVKDLRFKLPQGMIGNPTPFVRCSDSQFGSSVKPIECPSDSIVGVATLVVREPLIPKVEQLDTFTTPVFNMNPRPGEPARFGMRVAGIASAFLDAAVRTGTDYGVTVSSEDISEVAGLVSARVTFWGTPGDHRHDAERGVGCLETPGSCASLDGSEGSPFLIAPTSCEGAFSSTVEGDPWNDPQQVVKSVSEPSDGGFEGSPSMTGCNHLPFGPEMTVTPDVARASTPTGVLVNLHEPEVGVSSPTSLVESALRGASVKLPAGVTLNPGGANGLEACTEAQIGFLGKEDADPARNLFTPTLPEPFCPDGAKVGTVKITTPLLPNPLEGGVYIATPAPTPETTGMNPFNSFVAMYIEAQDPVSGTLVKLPGKVTLCDEAGEVLAGSTCQAPGQLITTFEETPQVPFEDLTLNFFEEPGAALTTPDSCGSFTTASSFTSWAGGRAVEPTSTFTINAGPDGGPCPASPAARPFAPGFNAESTDIQAAGFSPFQMALHRPDADQPVGAVSLTLPPGLLGTLSSVKLCPEPQAAQGMCGPESLIGHTSVRAGLGPDPVAIKPGNVYLTGPYKGAPFGLSIANPAAAGPFDLGESPCDCIVLRGKVEVDPLTAQLKVASDPLPTIKRGIPLQLQDLEVTVDRPDFTFNPTDCNPMSITGTVSSSEGASANVSSRFQVANCATLAFKPKFKGRTSARTSRKRGASLSVKLTYPKGAFGKDANLAKVKVVLPKQLPSRLSTLNKACPSTVFEANPASCPAASKVGEAKALTPVLPVAMEGPAYFVSYGNAKFPELVIVLQGYGVTIQLHGETFISKKGITSSTFRHIPDVPIDSFELTLPQGPNSAFASGWNLCASKLHMPTSFVAQNGMAFKQNVPIAVSGCRRHKRAPKARHHKKH